MSKHLERLGNGSVVFFELDKNKTKIRIEEACDFYFGLHFNKKEFGELIEELMKLHSEMKED